MGARGARASEVGIALDERRFLPTIHRGTARGASPGARAGATLEVARSGTGESKFKTKPTKPGACRPLPRMLNLFALIPSLVRAGKVILFPCTVTFFWWARSSFYFFPLGEGTCHGRSQPLQPIACERANPRVRVRLAHVQCCKQDGFSNVLPGFWAVLWTHCCVQARWFRAQPP